MKDNLSGGMRVAFLRYQLPNIRPDRGFGRCRHWTARLLAALGSGRKPPFPRRDRAWPGGLQQLQRCGRPGWVPGSSPGMAERSELWACFCFVLFG